MTTYSDSPERQAMAELRQERNRAISKAVVVGWEVAQAGGVEADCPFHVTDNGLYTAWLAGFRDGAKGYTLWGGWKR